MSDSGNTIHLNFKKQFDARYSILGTWLKGRISDPRQAEGYYILGVVLLVVLFTILNYLAWAIFEDVIRGEQAGMAPYLFFGAQIGSLVFLVSILGVGFKPALQIEATKNELKLVQGSNQLETALDDIEEISLVSSVNAHRHYSRYASSRFFTASNKDQHVMCSIAGRPILVGAGDESIALFEFLQQHTKQELPETASSLI